MPVNLHISSTPKHLRITPTMVDDFLIDPVLGIYVIMGVKLDVFQASIVRDLWWVPNVIDSSGFGTGKSFRVWLVSNLRALLIGDHHVVVYYQTFQAMKDIYWQNYSTIDARRAPIFAAQLGRLDAEGDVDGTDNSRGAACYKRYFKNESIVFGPAPNWIQEAKGQAGLTFNDGWIDEFTKVETMTKKSSRYTNEDGHLVGGIDQQIIGRIRRSGWNQHHPLWGNHIVFTATAESQAHPSFTRYKFFLSEIRKGNPNYQVVTSCFKDFSNRPTHREIRIEDGDLKFTVGKPFKEAVPNWNAIQMMKGRTRSHFQREALGLWARETRGWYAEDALDRCVAAGIAAGTQPECARNAALAGVHYFEGIDPAPAQGKKADDGAKTVLRARPKPGLGRPPTSNVGDWLAEYVWAYRVRGEVNRRLDDGVFVAQRAREWSGLIHQKHHAFGFSGILMDSQGGGQQIWPELNKTRQIMGLVEREVVPISAMDDYTVGNAHRILLLFLREYLECIWPALPPGVDSLYNAMHTAFQEAVEHAEVLFPKPYNDRPREETEGWSLEQKWALKNLDAARVQLMDIQVATKDNGEWDLTRNGAKRFSSAGKKDLAYSMIFAYIRFLVWLKMGELEFQMQDDDEPGMYVV